MLKTPHQRLARIAASIVAGTIASLSWPVPAHASGVTCVMTDPQTGRCQLEARWEQASTGEVVLTATTGGGSILQDCQRSRRPVNDTAQGPAVVPCYGGDTIGWYSAKHDCYFTRRIDEDFIDLNDVVYRDGTRPGDEGALYLVQCFLEHYSVHSGWTGQYIWFLPSPPDGFQGYQDPTGDLIVEAVNRLQLRGPAIGTAPPSNSAGLVGVPVWYWTEITDHTWGTQQATATAMGITVTAHAEARHIQWHPGDGSSTITCDAGKPWQPGDDPLHPPCGHTYTAASRHLPDGRYEITGITTWDVSWTVTGGPQSGASGTITLTPQSQTTLRINELQVLVTNP